SARERLHEGPSGVAGRRVHDDPRGLVDDKQAVVLEGHLVRGAGVAVRGRPLVVDVNLDPLPLLHDVALRARAAVDGGGAGFEEPLGRRPRSHLGPRGERHVEPFPGLGRARDEGKLAAGHLSLRARGPSITYNRPRIPTTIAMSARL